MAWQKITIQVPEGFSKDQRELAAQAFVDRMVENATNGQGVKGSGGKFSRKKFPAYTEKYEKIKGSGTVDLTLSGEMLSALHVISTKKGKVVVGFDNGSEANAKAEGNILGSYGGKPNPKRSRNFLGLVSAEVLEIVNSLKQDDEDAS